jgi:hypothetical protein
MASPYLDPSGKEDFTKVYATKTLAAGLIATRCGLHHRWCRAARAALEIAKNQAMTRVR